MSKSLSASYRASEEYARRIFEYLCPNAKARTACARLFANSILVANEQSHSCWSVTLFSDRLRLNVGPIEVAVLSSSGIYLILDAQKLKLTARMKNYLNLEFSQTRYSSVPIRKAFCELPFEKLKNYSFLEAAHQAFIQRAGEQRKTTPFKGSFSDGVIRYFNSLLGMALPRPSWFNTDDDSIHLLPDETSSVESCREGAMRQVWVNVYERNHRARTECLKRFGTNCFICDFDFEQTYGAIGKGLIHVHHLKPLSEIGEEYEVTPEHLRPVCPNCHAIIHYRRENLMGIEEVKAALRHKEITNP